MTKRPDDIKETNTKDFYFLAAFGDGSTVNVFVV